MEEKTKNKWTEYDKVFKELMEVTEKLKPYYDIDKVKGYSVYVWTKKSGDSEEDWGENVFDIQADKIVYYVEDHVIIEDAIPIVKEIQKIQTKLKECVCI